MKKALAEKRAPKELIIEQVSNGFHVTFNTGQLECVDGMFIKGTASVQDEAVFTLLCDLHEFIDTYFASDAKALIEASKKEKE